MAAGQSNRMRGGDKLLELVDGLPLLRCQIDKSLRVSNRVFVALPSPKHSRTKLLTGTSATPIYVPNADEGIGASLRCGVFNLPDCAAFMLLLGDLPALTSDDLACVIAAQTSHPDHLIWRGATEDDKPGHPIIFDKSLRPGFAALHGDTGGETLTKPLVNQTFLVPLRANHARLDLDTPEDWAAWRAATCR